MFYFLRVFLKVTGFLSAILVFIFAITLISYYANNDKFNDYFQFIEGEKNSKNKIVIYNLTGPILNDQYEINQFTNYKTIYPQNVKNKLKIIEKIKPKILIININSPGGTVSASHEIYRIFNNFNKNNEIKTFFHTNELLASGAYWASMSGDKIYASYGAIIGSIGVKGPDWFFYDKPTSISSGIFGNTIETKNEIKVYSLNIGKSKDILNPFRKPTKVELDHLQLMINSIYDDFINVVSKNRKLDINSLRNKIGAQIYNSHQAKKNFLIDDELSLSELIIEIINENKFKDFQILENSKKDSSIFKKLLSIYNINYKDENIIKNSLCYKLKTNLTSILSYQSVGC